MKLFMLSLVAVVVASCAAVETSTSAKPAERVSVTGSRILRAGGADSGASRVMVISREQLDQTGEADLSEALLKASVLLRRQAGGPIVVH